MNEEINIIVLTKNNYFGLRFWEIKVTEKAKQPLHFCLELSVISELGVTKTINGVKKLETWLNSNEGISWIKECALNPFHSGIGTFLKGKTVNT